MREHEVNNIKCTCPMQTLLVHTQFEYVPLAHVGPLYTRVGHYWVALGLQGSFRYQHVGIPNAKVSHWGDYPTRGSNARGFALRWNIGFIGIHNYKFKSSQVCLCLKGLYNYVPQFDCT